MAVPEDARLLVHRQQANGVGVGSDIETEDEDEDEEPGDAQAVRRQSEEVSCEDLGKGGVAVNAGRSTGNTLVEDVAESDEEPAPLTAHVDVEALRRAVMMEREEEEEEVLAPGPCQGPSGPHRVVLVSRPKEIEEVRGKLPIIGLEQDIMEAVTYNDVVVLCGETGCGKTTQVPQFLLEAGYGCKDFPEKMGTIGVTQPRRVAAVSTAQRVAAELGTSLGQQVGYQVRYDKKVGGATAIKFMTDGILLREIQEDFLLTKYSVLLLDEAHERSLNTDLLIGLLSRVVPLRRKMWEERKQGKRASSDPLVYPLKLIIMSATLRTEDFVKNQKLFPTPPPIVEVPTRQFPVVVHFSRRTELDDYVGAAYRKVCRIHRELPPGGILVFVTGQREVEYLCRRIREHFAGKKGERVEKEERGSASNRLADDDPDGQAEEVDDPFGADHVEASGPARGRGGRTNGEDDYLDMNEEDDLDADGEESDDDEVVMLGGDAFTEEEIKAAERRFEEQYCLEIPRGQTTEAEVAPGQVLSTAEACGTSQPSTGFPQGYAPVHVLPLYAMLPANLQSRVFGTVPEGHRLVVVATNVAETSLTIPGIRYVVDAGRSKQKLLENSGGGLARFEVRWISKASAEQRAGRAGRTGPGHCYRLYSSAHFNDTFPLHSPPEIVNTPLEGVVLMMKNMGVDKVANFPFPSPPELASLKAAEQCLQHIGALKEDSGQLTAIGRAMARLPISPRHARMLLDVVDQCGRERSSTDLVRPSITSEFARSRARLSLPWAIALAAALSVESPFIHVENLRKEEEDRGEGSAVAGPSGFSEEEKQALRKRHDAAHAAHHRLSCADSDAISVLNAFSSFLAAGEQDDFCQRNFLHSRNLKEMAELTRQLSRTLRQQGYTDNHAGGTLGEYLQDEQELIASLRLAPSSEVQAILRRAAAAGWADQVSRRMRSAAYVQKLMSEDGRKKHAIRYQGCCLDEEVYLHPGSQLYRGAPEYVVYTQLIRGAKRPYMAGVTAIDPQWLTLSGSPLCRLSAPLEDPPPFYKKDIDQVMCWYQGIYGPHQWSLPLCLRPHPDPRSRAAVLAAALLEGQLFKTVEALRPHLLSPPSSLLRAELLGLPRVGEVISCLAARKVDSRKKLLDMWKVQPTYLQSELAMWLAPVHHPLLRKLWPLLVAEVSSYGAAGASPGKLATKKKRRECRIEGEVGGSSASSGRRAKKLRESVLK